ncbi:mCG147394 [Mus musculus]|nr:mCG147394 [Mus musculus]
MQTSTKGSCSMPSSQRPHKLSSQGRIYIQLGISRVSQTSASAALAQPTIPGC